MLSKLLGSVGDAILSGGGVPIPGGSLASAAYEAWEQRRLKAAREILLQELKCGIKDEWDARKQDELAAIVFRYCRAAREGAARRNLRLLAQIIDYQLATNDIVANEFLAWSDVLAGLRAEELSFLAALCRVYREDAALPGASSNGNPYLWEAVISALVPSRFRDESELQGVASSCLRTGLVAVAGGTWAKPIDFVPTPHLTRLLALVDVEGVAVRSGEEEF